MNRCASPLLSFLLIVTSSCTSLHQADWTKLPSIPDAQGFAGSFAGVSNGALMVAGGANMLGDKWGTNFHKQWYDSVFILENPQAQWRVAGKLPRPLGYGASITMNDAVVCVGGSDSARHYADAFSLSWKNRELKTYALPSLPKTCANCCAAALGHWIYVAGGLESPTATNAMRTFWAFDPSAENPQWMQLEPWPGPERMLAVAGVLNGEFFLVSGARLKTDANGKVVREYLKDAYAYSPERGWRRIADVPRAVVAAPSPAFSGQQLMIISGDDGSKVDLTPSPAHPGFPRDALTYDYEKDRWIIVSGLPFSRATAPTVKWNGHEVVVMGEVRPRERTTEVWWKESP